MQLTRFLTAAVTVAFLCTPASAQLEVFGGAGVRASTMVGYWSDATHSATGLAIQYGQGVWKDEYEQKLDQLKGKRARLGKDWWTTLDTSLKLDFGGVTVPPGSYFLGLQCDQDGKFALALLDANKAMAASAMPFLESAWKIDLSVPMTLEKGVLKQTVELMTIALEPGKDDQTKITLSITWGKHRLSANCKAGLPADKDAGANKDEKGKKGQTAKVVERGTDAAGNILADRDPKDAADPVNQAASPAPAAPDADVNDRILVDKIIQTIREPRRWDITVFAYPLQKNQNYVKPGR